MRNDIIQQFVTLQRQLTSEKKEIEARLRQINEALGEITAPAAATSTSAASVSRGGSRPRSGTPLRVLVLDALRQGPKTKEEVLATVQKRGFKFTSKDPLNSLGVILYGKNPKFNRVDGRFSLPAGAGARADAAASQSQNGTTGRRQMSAAARARIAAAARRRWAQVHSKQSKAAIPARSTGSAGKRTMSPAAKARIAEAARRRWAAVKAAGRNNL